MAFKTFEVKDWKLWMTECVILHIGGITVNELSLKFDVTPQHIANILRSSKAQEIKQNAANTILEDVIEEQKPKISLIISKAINEMGELVGDRILKETAPMSYWDQLRKTVETLSKLNDPTLLMPAGNVTIQQNIQNVLSAGPEVLKRLREGATLPIQNVAENVEYLGAPPPRESAGELYAGRVDTTTNQGQDGPALSGPISLDAARSKHRRLAV